MALEQIVFQLTNEDNNIRGQAERAFNEATKQPELLLTELLQIMRTSAIPSVKSMSAILFRRYAFEEEKMLWNQCSDQTKHNFKAYLLQALMEESERTVRQKICHIISTTGKFVHGDWPELLPCMFNCCNSPNEQHREAALEIFANLPTMFGDSLTRYIGVLKEVFQKSLSDPSNKVKLSALKATVSFLLVIEDNKQRNIFTDLLPPMIQVIALALNNQDEGAARDSLDAFIELAETNATFLRPSLDVLIPAMSQITTAKALDDGIRHLALELLVTMAENAPAMIRKYKPYLELTYPAAWSLMVDLDDDQEWHTTNEIEDDETDSNAVVGEQAVDRIACALGGKTVLPYAFSVLPAMLQNPDWKYRHAALMTISAIGEGCAKVLERELDKILALIVQHLNDPHPRVRYALCNALGQMSSDFAPTIQQKFHQLIVPSILKAMDDQGNPRVQAHGAAALVNFSEDATKQILMPYLDSILSKLLILIRMPERRYVMEQAVTTIATVADTAQERFLQYYDTFMPVLVEMLTKANTKEYRLLRGKTIECISLIGLAVGKEKFMNDAKNVMNILISTQSGELEPDDPQIAYMLSSWARIGAVLGEDFIPYLPVVMPPLLRSAKIRPDLVVIGPDDENKANDNYDPSDGWEFVVVDGQKIGIKTSNLEEKCTAVEMLYCYAKELKAGFHNYARPVLEIVVPLLKFYFDDSVRVAAAVTIAPLLKSVQLANYAPNAIHEMWLMAVDHLLDVIQSETEPDILCKLLEGFYTSVEVMGQECLNANQLAQFGEGIRIQLTEVFERDKARKRRRQDDDYDEEVEASLADESVNDEYTLRELSEAIHSVFKTHRALILPAFESSISLVAEMLSPERTPSERQWALCVFDDIVEYTGPMSWNYSRIFLQPMLNYILDPAPEVRQAAAYGAGVCGMYGGSNYDAACQEALPRLVRMITSEGSRDDDNLNATENAISAIAKIVEFRHGQYDANNILATWLTFLPVVADTIEAAYVYNFLCTLIETNNSAILGLNNSNLPKIFSIFTEVLTTDVFDDGNSEIINRVINLMKTIETQVPQELKQALWGEVSETSRSKLAEMF